MFVILCIHGFVSIVMTTKLSDASIRECYQNDDEGASSTETKTFEIGDLLNKTSLKGQYSDSGIEWGFTFVIVTIYGNDALCMLGLGYGVYKYMISRRFESDEYQRI